jgi:hypothetical protein
MTSEYRLAVTLELFPKKPIFFNFLNNSFGKSLLSETSLCRPKTNTFLLSLGNLDTEEKRVTS